MRPIIETRNLSFSYNKNGPKILDSINLEVDRGSITAFMGLSGCGKSTLAFCLCGIIPKSLPGIVEGNIFLDGKDINDLSLPNLSQRIGMVFQEVENQIFLPTVEAEIAFAPENLCYTYDEIESIIKRILSILNIEHLRYRNPSQLSGGEKHLIAIASVLSLDPEIIILDEVLSELDGENKERIIETIMLLQRAGKTIIIIDHGIENLMLADTIYLMKNGSIKDRIEGDKDYELLFHRFYNFFLQ